MYEKFVQNMPIKLIAPWRNPTPSPNNDLELSMDINANGIKEPVIIGVGVFSRQIRLETGNHRIYLCPRMGMTHLPCIARVWNYVRSIMVTVTMHLIVQRLLLRNNG